MSFTVNIKKNLPSLENKAVQAGVYAGMLAASKFVTAEAKTLAPVDSGNLKNSIFSEGSGIKYKIGTPVDYAPYVEYGTKTQKAKPYLRPAVLNNIATITKIISTFLGRYI